MLQTASQPKSMLACHVGIRAQSVSAVQRDALMFTFFGLFRRATPAAPPPAASPVEAAQKPWWQQPQLDQPLPDSAHRRQQQRRQREEHHSDDEFEDACDADGAAPIGSRLHGQQQQGTAAAETDVPMRSRRKAALKRPMRRAVRRKTRQGCLAMPTFRVQLLSAFTYGLPCACRRLIQ